jgi:hypothetical protein
MANSGGSREWGVRTRVFQEQILAATIVLLFQAFHPVNSPFHPPDSLFPIPHSLRPARFYNEQDFRLLGYLAQPRVWSNRLTVAALVVAVVNFGVEWNLRNCLKTRFANERQIAWLKKSNEEAS